MSLWMKSLILLQTEGQGRSEDYAFGGVHDSIFPTKWAWFVLNHAHFDVVYSVSSICIWSEIFQSPSEAKYGGQWRP